MNKTVAALAAMAALIISGCGLKDDLYIPTEEPAAVPVDDKTTDDQSTEKEPGRSAPDPSADQAP